MNCQVEGGPVNRQVIVASHQQSRARNGPGAKPPGTPNKSKNQSVDYRGPPRTGHTRKVLPLGPNSLTKPLTRSANQANDGKVSLVVLDQ